MNSKLITMQHNRGQRGISPSSPTRVLFVCLGNICRSPSAQGIFEHLAAASSGECEYRIDSAGIADYHIGKAPDRRAVVSLMKQGLDISAQRCRQITVDDFSHFDLVVGMDERNMLSLEALCPEEHQFKLRQMANFLEDPNQGHIPDPFHGKPADFDDMVELLFQACQGMLAELENTNLFNTEKSAIEVTRCVG